MDPELIATFRNLTRSHRRHTSEKLQTMTVGDDAVQRFINLILSEETGIVIRQDYVVIPEPHYLSHVFIANAKIIYETLEPVQDPTRSTVSDSRDYRDYAKAQYRLRDELRLESASSSLQKRILHTLCCCFVIPFALISQSLDECYFEYTADGEGVVGAGDDDDDDVSDDEGVLCCFSDCKRRRFYNKDFIVQMEMDMFQSIVIGLVQKIFWSSIATTTSSQSIIDIINSNVKPDHA